ncbi:MerR family transcriptional regulator [Aeromicrobium chenweiae]|uniref:MerR family transcriptional regulator n=1 Tax=Aeromicrobium chenweiae TaxID=2079793 RepID=A0A2S0WMB1_9ACTN|nr:MerR family transcriptional regulator [Aeromicrobium chenweiae]AWB92446.1 MerR family transcriptional regulator [Aeromicrobium chenweiae]TGN31264.1 MerR family transcriptional regulator [Aeromicrobium chenweiae]
MTQPLPELSRLGIGKVLDELLPEFPDLTITKIRYLESEGLLEPERTPSGYRKFSFHDVERLRFILRQQRDKFWPLGHIRQVLDDMDRGVVPDTEQAATTRVPHLSLAEDGLPDETSFLEGSSTVRLSRAELIESAGIDDATLDAIEEFGLIKRRRSQTYYDGTALQVAALVGEFAELGLEPRHLKMFSAAADREVALFDQVVSPRSRRLDKDAAERTIAGLAALSIRLQAVLVRSRLHG